MALASTPDRPHGEFAMRYESRLNRGVRFRMHVRREELIAALGQLDEELRVLTRRRQEILTELGDLRD